MGGFIRFVPNIITSFRIVGAAVLLAVPPFSRTYFLLYTLCGISDVADGTLARRLKISSELGAVLDSIADILFYSSLLIRLVPYLFVRVSPVVWYLVAAVVAIRLAAYIVAALKFKRFSSCHTYGNKTTGASVFFTPYLLMLLNNTAVCIAVCAVGALSSAEELLIHIKSKTYNQNIKSILLKNNTD